MYFWTRGLQPSAAHMQRPLSAASVGCHTVNVAWIVPGFMTIRIILENAEEVNPHTLWRLWIQIATAPHHELLIFVSH